MESIDYFTKEESFKGKNVVITGAYGGIGSLLTEALILCGARIIAIGKNEKKMLEKFNKYVKDKKYEFGYEMINLEDPPGITKGFKNIMIKLGGRIDILILCHGVFKVGKLMDTGIDVFDSALNINVRSCFHLISLATPFLKISQGNIVAVSSVEAKIFAREGFANSVSKAMLNSLIECSALELSSFGIRVNGVAPSITATNHRVSEHFDDRSNKEYLEKMGGFFLLNKEVLDPRDVVNAVLYLASDDACFVTGEIITVDNGYSLNHDLSFAQDYDEEEEEEEEEDKREFKSISNSRK